MQVLMKLHATALTILLVTGLVLACSGCTVKIANLTQNKTVQTGTESRNLPVYPNASRTFYSNVPVVGQLITYTSNDTPHQVLDFYKSQMQERGYNVSRSFTSANETGGLIIFVKGQDTVWVTVGQSNGSNGQTSIAVRTSFPP
jgi:hypothetical protein